MPRILKILFIVVLVANLLIFGVYFYYKRGTPKEIVNTNSETETTISQDNSGNYAGSKNYLLTVKPERSIQGLFIKSDESKLYFIDKEENKEKNIRIVYPVLYICTSPTQTEAVTVDVTNPGYIHYLDLHGLNVELRNLETILITTLKENGGTEKVNYIASAKCPLPTPE